MCGNAASAAAIRTRIIFLSLLFVNLSPGTASIELLTRLGLSHSDAQRSRSAAAKQRAGARWEAVRCIGLLGVNVVHRPSNENRTSEESDDTPDSLRAAVRWPDYRAISAEAPPEAGNGGRGKNVGRSG